MRRLASPLALSVLSTIVLAVPAGASAGAEFRKVAETEHARYYAARGAAVDVRHSEEFLRQLLTLFGPTPSEWRLEYYRHSSMSALAAQVGFAAVGVTDIETARIDSAYEYHPHELVHAVAGRLGRPPLLLAEGLAVALTAHGVWRGRDVDAVAREYLAAQGVLYPLLREFALENPDRDYAVAGSFVGFLLDRHGIAPLLAVFEGCGSEAGRYEAAFRSAYGKGFADLERDWRRSLSADAAPAARAWYDAGTWPGSLRTSGSLTAALAPVEPRPGVATNVTIALEPGAAEPGPASSTGRP